MWTASVHGHRYAIGNARRRRAPGEERAYFNEVDQGNHFAAWQEPELFTEEVRAGFRSLR